MNWVRLLKGVLKILFDDEFNLCVFNCFCFVLNALHFIHSVSELFKIQLDLKLIITICLFRLNVYTAGAILLSFTTEIDGTM